MDITRNTTPPTALSWEDIQEREREESLNVFRGMMFVVPLGLLSWGLIAGAVWVVWQGVAGLISLLGG